MDIQTAKQIRIADYLHSLGSVSYTHLDVYKRQNGTYAKNIKIKNNIQWRSTQSVSYTHLVTVKL